MKEHLENNSVPKSMINTLALMDNNSAKIFTNLCRLAVIYQITDEEEVFDSYESLRPSQRELELISVC